MEHVQLRVGHGVDQALDRGEGLVMTRRIHENATVREARSVVDDPRSVADHIRQTIKIKLDQLRQCLQSVHGTERVHGSDDNIGSVLGNLQSVRLVNAELKLGLVLLHGHAGLANTLLHDFRLAVEDEIVVSLERTNEFVGLGRGGEAEVVSIDRHGLVSMLVLLRKRPDVRHVCGDNGNAEDGK